MASPETKDRRPYKSKERGDTPEENTQSRGHVKSEAETGVWQLQPKGPWSHHKLEEERRINLRQ